MSSKDMDGLALALEAIEALPGWKAFCVQSNKKPYRGSRGFLDATDDADELARMWRPGAMAALAVPDGFVAVDLDSPDAEPSFRLPVTKAQRTRRGKHLFYRTREPVRPAVAIDDHVDIRGPGSYVVLYEAFWSRGPRRFAEAPEELYERARRNRLDLASEENETWGEGERDLNLTRAAGKLKNAGLSTNELLAALHKMNEQRCVPPLPRHQVEKIARSSMAWDVAEEGVVLPFPTVVYRNNRAPVASDPQPKGIDAADLLAQAFEPLAYAIEDLLPEGTAILAAEPKIGKSWMAYQMCVEVALGGKFLGRRARRGSALYYALEDGPRRGQDRLRKALRGRRMPKGALEVRWAGRPIGRGLEEELVEWLDSHPDAVLVVIDTLQKVRPPSSGKRGSYEVDVEDLGRIQDVFRDRRVALLIVHHARKAKGDDFLAQVSGTFGITGSADTTLVLKRKRNDDAGTLDITGRDVMESELFVRFDPVGLWQGTPGVTVVGSGVQKAIHQWLADNGPEFPLEIGKAIGMSRVQVQQSIGEGVKKGFFRKTKQGYEACDPEDDRAAE